MFCDPVGEEFQPYQKDAKVSTLEGSVPPVPEFRRTLWKHVAPLCEVS